jgi:hypothetical protein
LPRSISSWYTKNKKRFALPLYTIVDDTGNIDGTILRVVAITGTSCGTSSAAIGDALYHYWRPEDLNIATGTTYLLSLLR